VAWKTKRQTPNYAKYTYRKKSNFHVFLVGVSHIKSCLESSMFARAPFRSPEQFIYSQISEVLSKYDEFKRETRKSGVN
jgi:hypothetical protein